MLAYSDPASYGDTDTVDSASYGGTVEPPSYSEPTPTRRPHYNQGIGNGAEGGDPGKSRPHGSSNDELGQTPGSRKGSRQSAGEVYDTAGYGGSVEPSPSPSPTRRPHYNQGIGNGAEGGDPGKSRPHGSSNDELGQTPGSRKGSRQNAGEVDDTAGYGGSIDLASYGGSVEPSPRPTRRPHYNQGIGNGAEGGDPGKSRPHGSSNDELGRTPGSNYGKNGELSLKGSLGKDVLHGKSKDDSLYGMKGHDRLQGGDGDDTLDGGSGKDMMIGGRGNDTYFVDHRRDRIVEMGGRNQGMDVVNASVTWVLGNNLENLTLTGTEAINGMGNRLNNSMTGNMANNVLNGGGGNDLLIGSGGDDTLIGGKGADQFVYKTGAEFAMAEVGMDTIVDFMAGTDKLVLSKTTFGALGSLVGNGFSVVSDFSVVATDAEVDRSSALVVYSAESKGVFYNQNGAVDGLGTGAKFATVSSRVPGVSLSASDFVIQA